MGYIAAIGAIAGLATKLIGGASGPSYPGFPKLHKINIPAAQNLMEQNESDRMAASIDAWKSRFPLLYKGGAQEISDIGQNQAGMLNTPTEASLQNAGLESPKQGNVYSLAKDIGLSPITLAQRNSQAVTRQIALNPEWTNKISGGTLASLMANNYQNQNAFTQFLGSANTANFITGQQNQAQFNTAAILGGLGATQLGFQASLNANPNNPLTQPFNPYSYASNVPSSGVGYGVTTPNYYGNSWGGSVPAMYQPSSGYNISAPPYPYNNSYLGTY